jgi:lysyl-tRNA synthetase, class II
MKNLNEIKNKRIKKLEEIRKKGIDPYGRRFAKSHSIKQLKDDFKEGMSVKVAGRITALRSHGKSSFFDIKDETDRIQAYIKKGEILEEDFWLFERLDIGDIVGAEGKLFKTKTNETTIQIERLHLLSKSLRPLPEKWHGLKDVEIRFRQRYLDLISNDEVKEVFKKRSQIIERIKDFLNKRGFLEIETPMMHYVSGGAAGKPFSTHADAFDRDLYLRIAPELYLKKLLVGGFEKIYELNRSFRNEGISTKHNPEFTMLEVYQAYSDYEDMMSLCEDLITYVAKEALGTLKIEYQGKKIDLTPPWRRKSFAETIGVDPNEKNPRAWKKILSEKFGIDVKKGVSRSSLIKLAEDLLDQEELAKPTFFTDYFTEVSPLAKRKKESPLLAERFELFIGGLELANAYSELNDPREQAERIRGQDKGDEDKRHKVDEDFLASLEYGMPPAGGLGIGVDRLVMLLTNRASIREVILFPQLRPEQTDSR